MPQASLATIPVPTRGSSLLHELYTAPQSTLPHSPQPWAPEAKTSLSVLPFLTGFGRVPITENHRNQAFLTGFGRVPIMENHRNQAFLTCFGRVPITENHRNQAFLTCFGRVPITARRAQRRAQLVPPSLASHGPEPAAIFITRRSASTTNAATERRDQDAATKPHCRGKLHERLPVATTWRTSAICYTPKNQ